MKRGSPQSGLSRRHQVAQKAFLCLGTLGLVCGASAVQAIPASATPIPPSTSNCSYGNTTTPANPAAVTGVTPGSAITVSCAAGSLPASATMLVVEASGLAGIISPMTTSAQIGEIDTSDLGVASSGADGSLSTSFTVPASFGASDPNAACPPTQAQINIGLTCDLIVISVSTLTPVNEAMLVYSGQGTPNTPTLHATFRVHRGVKTLTASDVAGACPTPPTATSHCWWGAPVTGAPNPAAFGGVPAPEGKVSKLITSGDLSVSPAVYCATGATAPACASVPAGTLIPPALSGSVTTKRGLQPFLVNEPNATPYPGNGTLPSLFSGTQNVGARQTGPPVRMG
jgi:hypothetical protein